MEKPLSAYMRENKLLRDIAEAAIKCRGMWHQIDQAETALEKLYEERPDMTRSATMQIMLHQALRKYEQQLENAIASAAAAGLQWEDKDTVAVLAIVPAKVKPIGTSTDEQA